MKTLNEVKMVSQVNTPLIPITYRPKFYEKESFWVSANIIALVLLAAALI